MGVAGTMIGGALLGLGAASMRKTPSFSMPTEVHANMAPSKPETPMAPNPVDASVDAASTQNAQMEAERERARQQALLRQQQAPEVFTSGLGAAGMAETSKKTLLGG